jgi:hypothetical protein|tara:strand:- start:127 stop:486 length:360 start_codon:yes stop_codon:yes gene_type:complete
MSRISKGLRNVSSKVLGKFGGDVTFKRITHGSYNTTTGTVSESVTSTTIKGILQNVNQREINDLIKENDKILIIAAADLAQTPTTSDRVLIASIEYQIIRINIDENDNQNIKYEIYLRA